MSTFKIKFMNLAHRTVVTGCVLFGFYGNLWFVTLEAPFYYGSCIVGVYHLGIGSANLYVKAQENNAAAEANLKREAEERFVRETIAAREVAAAMKTVAPTTVSDKE